MSNAWRPDTSFSDLVRNPKRYGIPSFEEFCKKGGKNAFKLRDDHTFGAVADNRQQVKNVRRYKHFFQISLERTIECRNQEHVEQVAKDEGLGFLDLDIVPQMRETETTGFYIEVTWRSKLLSSIIKMSESIKAEATNAVP